MIFCDCRIMGCFSDIVIIMTLPCQCYDLRKRLIFPYFGQNLSYHTKWKKCIPVKASSRLLTRIYCIGTWVWILKVYGLDAKQTDSAVTLTLFSQSITIFWIQFPVAWFVVITRFPVYPSIHSTWQILCCNYYLLGEQIVRYFFAACNNSGLQFPPHPNFYQFSKGCCIIYLQVDYFDWLFLGKYLYCKFLCNEYQHIYTFSFFLIIPCLSCYSYLLHVPFIQPVLEVSVCIVNCGISVLRSLPFWRNEFFFIYPSSANDCWFRKQIFSGMNSLVSWLQFAATENTCTGSPLGERSKL